MPEKETQGSFSRRKRVRDRVPNKTIVCHSKGWNRSCINGRDTVILVTTTPLNTVLTNTRTNMFARTTTDQCCTCRWLLIEKTDHQLMRTTKFNSQPHSEESQGCDKAYYLHDLQQFHVDVILPTLCVDSEILHEK